MSNKNEIEELVESLKRSAERMNIAAEKMQEANEKQAESTRKLQEATQRLRDANKKLKESLGQNNAPIDPTLNQERNMKKFLKDKFDGVLFETVFFVVTVLFFSYFTLKLLIEYWSL